MKHSGTVSVRLGYIAQSRKASPCTIHSRHQSIQAGEAIWLLQHNSLKCQTASYWSASNLSHIQHCFNYILRRFNRTLVSNSVRTAAWQNYTPQPYLQSFDGTTANSNCQQSLSRNPQDYWLDRITGSLPCCWVLPIWVVRLILYQLILSLPEVHWSARLYTILDLSSSTSAQAGSLNYCYHLSIFQTRNSPNKAHCTQFPEDVLMSVYFVPTAWVQRQAQGSTPEPCELDIHSASYFSVTKLFLLASTRTSE